MKATTPTKAELFDENKRLRAALEKAEEADQFHVKCEECDGEETPEACARCFPLADDARTMRWSALGINQPFSDIEEGFDAGEWNNVPRDPACGD